MSRLSEKMQTQISEKLMGAFDTVIDSKKDFYTRNPEKKPNFHEIDSMIKSSALTNAGISGGASLVPGPWGMLAVVPELVLVIKNQVGLIYDIAAAHGKEDLMNRELAISIFLHSLGNTTGSLLIMQGGKYIVRRSSLKVFQTLVAKLGGRVTQQAIKSSVSKWLPGIGAAAMATWTNYSTRKIGRKAQDIIGNLAIDPSQYLTEATENDVFPEAVSDDNLPEDLTDYHKIKVLISLSKIDQAFESGEQDFLSSAIERTELDLERKLELVNYLSENKVTKIAESVDAVKNHPDEAITLLAELTALAKIDDDFHITEKLFIKQIGKQLGFSEDEITEVMES